MKIIIMIEKEKFSLEELGLIAHTHNLLSSYFGEKSVKREIGVQGEI